MRNKVEIQDDHLGSSGELQTLHSEEAEMTDYKGLIERARYLLDPVDTERDAPAGWDIEGVQAVFPAFRQVTDALEATLARLEAAEALATAADEFNQKCSDIATWAEHDKVSALGRALSNAIRAWREAKSS